MTEQFTTNRGKPQNLNSLRKKRMQRRNDKPTTFARSIRITNNRDLKSVRAKFYQMPPHQEHKLKLDLTGMNKEQV